MVDTLIRIHRPLSAPHAFFSPFALLSSGISPLYCSCLHVSYGSAIKCLKNARQLGTVIIITNAESGWVEVR